MTAKILKFMHNGRTLNDGSITVTQYINIYSDLRRVIMLIMPGAGADLIGA